MIRIIKANKCYIKEMSKLFVDSFYDVFKSFTSDKNRLVKAFRHIFILDKFYIVLKNEELIGMGAVSKGDSTIKFNKFKLCFYFGLKKGKRIHKYLKTILEEKDYAFEMDELCGLIEYLIIKESYRKMGIGFTLINHIIYDNKYVRYIAKVGNNNYNTLRLLEKIDFEEFDRESATRKEKEEIGVDYYLYMIGERKE